MILPADTYYLISKSILTDEDRKILSLLYQPIIGAVATNLYFTFWSHLDEKKEHNHYHLMSNMGIKIEEIIKAREKLEAIGLIKSYIKKGNNSIKEFIYEIYAPLTAYEFISSPLLNSLLINNIGEKEYQILITKFKSEEFNLDEYEEITKKFSSVFTISDDMQINDNDIKKSLKNNIDIKDVIDIESIISLIPDEVLFKKSITKDTLKTIQILSYVYHLNEDDMKDIIYASIDTSHKIDKEKLKTNAKNKYEFNHNSKLKLVYQKQLETFNSKNLDDSKKDKMIYTFENTSPYDFLSSKYKGGNPTTNDLKIIEYLLDDLSFNHGVVNVLIDYVLKTNNDKLTKGYIETIAGQWKRKNIDTVPKAIELAKKEYSSKTKKTSKKTMSIEWVNKDIKSEIASKEEQEKIDKMLKELVGE